MIAVAAVVSTWRRFIVAVPAMLQPIDLKIELWAMREAKKMDGAA
jgi:hypothetical protein